MNKCYIVTRQYKDRISKWVCLTKEKAIECINYQKKSDIPNRELIYNIEEIYLY